MLLFPRTDKPANPRFTGTVMPMPDSEQRRHRRFSCCIPVVCETANGVYGHHLIDLSYGGAFVATDGPFTVGDRVRVSVKFPSYSEPLPLESKVVRVVSNGIGVVFEAF